MQACDVMALIDVGDTWQQDLDTAERLHKTILCQVGFSSFSRSGDSYWSGCACSTCELGSIYCVRKTFFAPIFTPRIHFLPVFPSLLHIFRPFYFCPFSFTSPRSSSFKFFLRWTTLPIPPLNIFFNKLTQPCLWGMYVENCHTVRFWSPPCTCLYANTGLNGVFHLVQWLLIR